MVYKSCQRIQAAMKTEKIPGNLHEAKYSCMVILHDLMYDSVNYSHLFPGDTISFFDGQITQT